jgi:hypothetical protein
MRVRVKKGVQKQSREGRRRTKKNKGKERKRAGKGAGEEECIARGTQCGLGLWHLHEAKVTHNRPIPR